MKPISHIQQLTTLKSIAETLNQSNALFDMLEAVLEKLLDMTGLTFGWIFLMEDSQEFTIAADRNLPSASTYNNKSPMTCGSCWCMDQYRTQRLTDAVNILNCHRLSKARADHYDDICSFTHHATLPLQIGERKFGILNVGAAGKEHFTDEELALLQAVAFQIGVAVERLRLHKSEQRKADQFTRLGAFSHALHQSVRAGLSRIQLTENAVRLLASHFEWSGAALLERTGDHYHVQAMHAGNHVTNHFMTLPSTETHWLNQLTRESSYVELAPEAVSDIVEHWTRYGLDSKGMVLLAAPISPQGDLTERILLIRCSSPPNLIRIDGEMLGAAAKQIAAAMEHARLRDALQDMSSS